MAVLLALVLALAPHTIRGDRQIGPLRVGTATFLQARAAYGPPPHVVTGNDPSECAAKWPAIGLSLSFL